MLSRCAWICKVFKSSDHLRDSNNGVIMFSTNVFIYKGIRLRAYPSRVQVAQMDAWQAPLRFLWNLANEQRLLGLAHAKDDKRYFSAFDQMKDLKELRADLPWLANVPRDICNELLVDLDKAWRACFNKTAGKPKFKSKSRDVLNFRSPNPKSFWLRDGLLHFPKLNTMRVVQHRPLEGKPKSCILLRDGDQWFVSVLCEVEIPDPPVRLTPVVALDRGVVNTVADSDGNLVVNPKHYQQSVHRLVRAQRNAARKKKGSRNKAKAQLRVMRIHRTIRRQREHFLHQISSRYSKSHAIIVMEKLQIKNMVRSASGSITEPSTNVAQKRGLNRSIAGAGWGKLAEQCKYKTAWLGGQVVEVPAAYSSQTCASCGHVDSKSRVTQARFECTACGACEHADTNAAIVLLQRFHARGNPSVQLGEASSLDSPRPKKRRYSMKRSKVEHPISAS